MFSEGDRLPRTVLPSRRLYYFALYTSVQRQSISSSSLLSSQTAARLRPFWCAFSSMHSEHPFCQGKPALCFVINRIARKERTLVDRFAWGSSFRKSRSFNRSRGHGDGRKSPHIRARVAFLNVTSCSGLSFESRFGVAVY